MTVFWRVDYDGDLDKQFMFDRGELGWPRDIPIKDRQKIGKRMRVGHGIVMGRSIGKIGRIEAVGHITEITPHPQKKWVITIAWQPISPKVVHPKSSGVTKWKKYPVFKFDPEPAKRYKLTELLQTHFGADTPAEFMAQSE